MNEIEVKAHVKNAAQIKKKLISLGIRFSQKIVQKDKVYFPRTAKLDKTTWTIKDMDKTLPALRIREQNGKYLFTYKIPKTNSLDKLEYETEISNAEQMEHICKELEFILAVRINKTRQIAHYKDFEICLDEVEGLGSFIEIEKMSNKPADKIQNELFAFLQTLGITKEDREFKGYDLLLLEKEI